MAWIEFTDAEGRTRKVEIPRTQAGVVLGRSNACQVVLRSPSVGRNHGKVLFQGGTYLYKDLGSVNGSFVNDQRIQGETPLKDGDSIRLGEVVVRFIGDPVAPEPAVRTLKSERAAHREAAPAPHREAAPAAPPKQAPVATPPASDALSLVEVSRLRKENEALRAEITALQQQVRSHEVPDVADLQQRLAEARSSLKEREDEVRHLRGVAADSERRLKDAETRAATANSSLESIHAKYMDMREQVAHAQGLLQQARDEASEREAEAADLRDRVASLQAQIDAARSRSGQTSEEVQNLKVKMTEKDREIERLKRELDIREYDLKALQEENERLQEYCASDTGQQRELERKIRNLEAVIEENRNLIEELRRSVADKDRELMAARHGTGLAEVQHEKQRLLDDFHKKSREVDELRAQVAALTAESGAARADAEGHLARIRLLEEAARIRKSEREDISDHPEYRARVREVERLTEQVVTLTRDVEALQRERDAFSPEERARLHAELQASQERIQALQGRLDETDKQLRAVRSEPRALEAPVPAPPAPDLDSGVADRLESLMDDVRVFQAEFRDILAFIERLDRSGAPVPDEVSAALHGVSLREALGSLRDLMRVLDRDAGALWAFLGERDGTRDGDASPAESENP